MGSRNSSSAVFESMGTPLCWSTFVADDGILQQCLSSCPRDSDIYQLDSPSNQFLRVSVSDGESVCFLEQVQIE